MAQRKSNVARIIVPIVASLLAIGFAYAVMRGTPAKPTDPKSTTPAATTPASSTPTAPAPTSPAPTSPAAPSPTTATAPTPSPTTPPPTTPTTPTTATPTTSTPGLFDSLRPLVYPTDPAATTLTPIGDLDPKKPWRAKIAFSNTGAGIATIDLAQHFDTIRQSNNTRIQEEHRVQAGIDANGRPAENVLTPFAALAIEIAPPGLPAQIVPLASNPAGPLWRQLAPGEFEAIIVNSAGERIARIHRAYILAENSDTTTLRQSVENLTSTPFTIRWYQCGPGDLPAPASAYGGDQRRVTFGYLLSAELDPSRSAVMADEYKLMHHTLTGSVQDRAADKLWPTTKSTERGQQFVWVSQTSRYFAVSAFPVAPPDAIGENKTLRWLESVSRLLLPIDPQKTALGVRLESKPLALAASGQPGAKADLSHAIFSGSLESSAFAADPQYRNMGLAGMIVRNMGGPCGFCTFGFLTGWLLWLMRSLHSLTHDWAIAIMLLVVVVRTILHPVTRWSQIKMGRFAKQMQAVGPKQKQLQEKYKDEPLKLREETAKLWREEGINPAGMLGCLPALMQTPVWIALYATLYFAAELRHQGAFFGVFQTLQPTSSPFWWFLGDLAEPDRFWYFVKDPSHYIHIPLLGSLIGPVGSLNVLPLILMAVFFVQQKYLTPPTTGPMTPEMEMQQKISKWMIVLLFPIMMYGSPSGLALYFITNSTLSILETKWIRRHMEKTGLLDLDKMKAERLAKLARMKSSGKPGGGVSFLERLQKAAEEKQKQTAQRAKDSNKRKK